MQDRSDRPVAGEVNTLAGSDWSAAHADTFAALWRTATARQRECLLAMAEAADPGESGQVERARQRGYDSGYEDGQAVVVESFVATLSMTALRAAQESVIIAWPSRTAAQQ